MQINFLLKLHIFTFIDYNPFLQLIFTFDNGPFKHIL